MSLPGYESYKDSKLPWLREIPDHWSIRQSRRMFALRKDRAMEGDRQLTASQKHGVIYQDDYVALEGQRVVQVIIGADILKHVEPNDFVISMRSFQGGIEWCGHRGSISSAYVMLIPSESIDVRFFAYLFKSDPYIQALQSTSNLVRDGQALRYENFTLIDLPVIPLPEQQAIAAFLDRETEKVDSLIVEQHRLIELLKEKRQAVISHAVTKGLNPAAPMKDSGVEWMGKVPQHWDILPLKWVTQNMCDGPFGSGLKSEHYVETGVRVIRLQNIRQGVFDNTDSAFIEEAYYREELGGHDVVSGDLLIAGLGDDRNSVGRACVAPEGIGPAMVKADCFRFRLMQERALPAFVALQLTAGSSCDAGRLASGSTRSRISLSVMASRTIALPPPHEQQSILNCVQERSAAYDALIGEAQLAINLLHERRRALISAAVTGKIDVRRLAMRTSEKEAAA